MHLLHNTTNNKQPKIKYEEYLSLADEPKEFRNYNVPAEIEDELLASRYFLKRRVWKNMEKIRRSKVHPDSNHKEHRKRSLRPHRLPV